MDFSASNGEGAIAGDSSWGKSYRRFPPAFWAKRLFLNPIVSPKNGGFRSL